MNRERHTVKRYEKYHLNMENGTAETRTLKIEDRNVKMEYEDDVDG